ncbi:MAG: hypothetical protein GX859_11900 [Corynebacterium humireducens]|jgi:predicted small secreted protein|uniref:AMIN-like domain-containing protein n=1 Tax=Corynebacterium humireducens TaxID=1223514 RepID=A0A7X6PQJ6_9CORY|nr:hypothetical protein [Corynebacterium humireducens]
MTAYRRPLATAFLATAGLLLAACNGGETIDGGTTTSAGPVTVTSTAPTPTPATTGTTTQPSPAADTTTQNPTTPSEPADRPLGTPAVAAETRSPVWEEPYPLLTGIRVGQHVTFDRVVYDFVGAGEPGWYAEYLDQPYQQGSGHDVDVAGNAYLKIDLTGTSYPFEHDAEALPIGPYPGGGVIAQVVNTGTFEGHTLTYIGLDEQRPYSVTVLHDPLRVVVDIAK